MFFITIIGLFLRLTFVNKREGLWNDEYVSWYIANTPFKEGFFNEILLQCHMPLYYFYLKPFSYFSDFILRLSSIIPGFLAIPIMYLVGKEYSKKIGIISAVITSTLSFLIYYSQEVRFYSLLFLFSAMSLLFTIRVLKNTNKNNITLYLISNILILLTHNLGIIYVFLNFIYVALKKQIFSKRIFAVIITIFLCTIPLGINILKMLPSSQWWGSFSYTNILFLFSDYFSPILTNNVNAPPVFFYNKNLSLWLTIPTLIAIIGMSVGIKKAKALSLISLLTIILLSILAILGKIVFITKYSIEILPILILLISIGFNELKLVGTTLLTIFIGIHISSFFTPYYVTKTPRSEGHRIVGEIIKIRKPQTIIFTYYEPNRFERYIDLKNKNTLFISKINRFEYIDAPNKILKCIKTNEKISVIFLDSVSFFDENFVTQNKTNKNIPEMFLTFSHIKNMLIKELNNNYKSFQVDKIGSWTVITAIKK